MRKVHNYGAQISGSVDLGLPMFSILLVLLCLVVLMVVIDPMSRHRLWSDERPSEMHRHKRAFDILDQRLPKGEIDRPGYNEKRRTIAQGR
jgi:uncharacterized membrane protein